MTDSNGYLSKDRDYLNRGQRARRARNPRVDYYPSRDALAIIEAKRGRCLPWNNNSGILDAIVTQWADLTGIKYQEVQKPKSPGVRPELTDAYAHANDFGDWLAKRAALEKAMRRVTCGAKTQSGKPCRAKSLPGKQRCKWHGGCSTGPKTEGGRAKALSNLRQNRTKAVAEVTS